MTVASLRFPQIGRGVAVLLSILFSCLAMSPFAKGSDSIQLRAGAEGSLLVPNAFRLAASNGFTLDVIANRAFRGRPSSVTIYAWKKGSGVRYTAPAVVTETSVQADLGSLGGIFVSFNRSNEATRVPCGKQKIFFDSGLFEGKINFQGEEGFTSAEASVAAGNIDFLLGPFCDEGVAESRFKEISRGASLLVRNPGLGAELSVSKRRPDAPAEITAWSSEYINGIAIARYAFRWMPSDAFKYDRRLRTAFVRPPIPFSGAARFDLGKKAGQRWSGNLAVGLPGKQAVALTGPTLRATLRHGG